TQQNRGGIGQSAGSDGALRQRGRLERVQHLHAGRDHRVVVDALVVVIGLFEQRVDFATQRARAVVDIRPVAFGLGKTLADDIGVRLTEGPYTAQETVRAFNPRIRPFQRLLGRAGKHYEQAGGIGAQGVDERLWIDTVVLGLRHRADAAVFHGRAVGL